MSTLLVKRGTLLASLIATALFSPSVFAIDLVQAYRDAMQNDAQFASARSAYTASQEKVTQGRSGLLPTVGLSGSSTRSSTDIEPEVGRSYNSKGLTHTWSLGLSQPLFNWSAWQTYEQSKLAVAAGETRFAQAKQDLLLRVAQAYFDVLSASDTLETLKAQKVAISEQLASAKRNFEVGTATITDTHEAQARYDAIVAQELAGESDLQVKRFALAQLIGKDANGLSALRPGVKLNSPQPAVIDEWVKAAEANNHGVVGYQIALESSKREIEKNRANHMPTVNLTAGTGRNVSAGAGSIPGNPVVRSNSIGVSWSIPLFAGFAVDSRGKELVALQDQSRSELESARRQAALGARQAYLGVTSGLAQVKALEASEISSQSALDSNKLGYQVGVRVNIDVLNAQQQLYTIRQQLSKARYDTILNGLRLKNAAGNLREEDLEDVNRLLQN